MVNTLLQVESISFNEDDKLERVMLEDKEINRKITKKCKSKVIRDSTRVGAVRAKKKKNKPTGNKFELQNKFRIRKTQIWMNMAGREVSKITL